MPEEPSGLVLVYDRECPICSAYVRMMRIRKDIGRLELVNARESSPIMDEITALDAESADVLARIKARLL